MRGLYNFLFTIFFWVASPYYFLRMWRRGNWRHGFGQRFARYSSRVKQAITNRHVIWFHAVSVGEVNICTQLIRALEPRLPNLKIVVSTTTSTGMGELKRKLPMHIEKIYYPIDRRSYVQRALTVFHPEAIVLVEAELWPNFLWHAIDKEIPLFLVNARLSQKSFRGYRRFGFLFRPIFQRFAGVGCQTDADAERLTRLGFRPEAIRVVGNLKFDAAKLDERSLLEVPVLLRQIGVPDDALVIVAGSTHAGEERILGEVFIRLRQRFPNLFLIVVPRHFERSKEAGRDLQQQGVRLVYRKEISSSTRLEPGSVDCLVVNTTGELKLFYERADVIFVGKSLTAEGGQNPIEPGALGKPMVFGSNMQNFAAIADAFVDGDGAIRVRDRHELEQAFAALLADEHRRAQLGKNALRVVQENRGAIERTVDMLLQYIDTREIYVAPQREVKTKA